MGDQVMDDLIKPELATRMASEVPNCTAVEVADAGHSVPLDNPVGFAAAVLPFLGV
jgi:pimeloyl-ACP methyl ester carboxylesterase